ncbi:MAG: hypothetical protein AAB300_04225 [Nitrospirota bacterium]
MGKSSYYIAKTIQMIGLGLVLVAWIISIMQNSRMDFLFSFASAGVGLFMAGWMVQKLGG